jgi:hypothetical protein
VVAGARRRRAGLSRRQPEGGVDGSTPPVFVEGVTGAGAVVVPERPGTVEVAGFVVVVGGVDVAGGVAVVTPGPGAGAAVLVPGTVVPPPGVVVTPGVVAAGGTVALVVLVVPVAGSSLFVSATNATMRTMAASAISEPAIASGSFQFGAGASRVRAGAPQFRHQSCCGPTSA